MLIYPVFGVALALLLLNIFGQTRSLRYRFFHDTPDHLYRFKRDAPLAYREALVEIAQLRKIENPVKYAYGATLLINKCLAHLEWTKLDAVKAYQTVPFWENPILWALGHFSGLEHYRRYNFTHYKRTLERGFGICGDASMVLSQLLSKKRIQHNIVAFNGHVLVEAEIDGKKHTLDADFGIATDHSLDALKKDRSLVTSLFTSSGYPESDGVIMGNILQRKGYRYASVYEFVPKRYLIERVSYWLFWFVPPIVCCWLLLLF